MRKKRKDIPELCDLVVHTRLQSYSYVEFCYIDDKKAIIDNSSLLIIRIFGMIIQIWFIYISIYGMYLLMPLNICNIQTVTSFILRFGLFSIATAFFINNIINPSKDITFNRMEGTITMPPGLINWRRRTITFPFKNVNLNYWGHSAFIMAIIFPNSKFIFSSIRVTDGYQDALEFLSFLVWYMDKNRPLPPDPRLDPYRKEDYLRRKAEGFPAPLFPAKVDTPEIDILQEETQKEK